MTKYFALLVLMLASEPLRAYRATYPENVGQDVTQYLNEHTTTYPGNATYPEGPHSILLDNGIKGINCEWVETADDSAKAVTTVAAYPVLGCGDINHVTKQGMSDQKLMCTGTARCSFTLAKASGNEVSFSTYFEHTMCAGGATQNYGVCPSANACVIAGGILDQVKAADLVAPGSKVFDLPKRKSEKH